MKTDENNFRISDQIFCTFFEFKKHGVLSYKELLTRVQNVDSSNLVCLKKETPGKRTKICAAILIPGGVRCYEIWRPSTKKSVRWLGQYQ